MSKIKTKIKQVATDIRRKSTEDFAIPSESLLGVSLETVNDICVVGGKKFFDKVKSTFPQKKISHFNTHIGKLNAVSDFAKMPKASAYVIGGNDQDAAYRFFMNYFGSDLNDNIEIFANWNEYEFAGGSVAIPSDAKAYKIYLYNHFSKIFNVTDDLLVRVEASTKTDRVLKTFMLKANETIVFSEEDIELPEGEKNITFLTYHPKLSGGRHYRWRPFVDVEFDQSIISLHGAHHFDKSRGISTYLRSCLPANEPVKVDFVYPDYNQNHFHHAVESEARELKDGACSFVLEQGHPSMFTYMHLPRKDFPDAVLSNHLVSLPVNFQGLDVELDEEMKSYLDEIEKAGIDVSPYLIPNDSSLNFELGISCVNVYPFPTEYSIDFHADGEITHSKKISLPEKRAYFYSEIAEICGVKDAEGLSIGIDWIASGISPFKIFGQPDYIVRNKETCDVDITEFQSCWRNIGLMVEKFPHWLQKSKSMVSGTKLIGRISENPDWKDFLVLCAGSGNRKFRKDSYANLHLISKDGRRTHLVNVDIGVPGYAVIDLKSLIVDIDFSPVSLYIDCPDLDLNAQQVTVTPEGATSIQHLWGY